MVFDRPIQLAQLEQQLSDLVASCSAIGIGAGDRKTQHAPDRRSERWCHMECHVKTSPFVPAFSWKLNPVPFLFLLTLLALSPAPLSAQSDAWLGGPGLWSVGANWSAMLPPTPDEDCFIPGKSSPTVDLGGTWNNLGVQNGSTIDLNPGYLDVYGGSIGNMGTIIIEGATLNVGGESANIVSLTAGGKISVTAANSAIAGFPGVGGTLINIDNTIQGQGSIGLGVLALENDAQINAGGGTLTVQPNAVGLVNVGEMKALSGSTLSFQGSPTTVFNNTGGVIHFSRDGSNLVS
jgi:hypothetical protein